MADENNKTNTAQGKELSLWKVYGICLLISTIFFFLFGFNSPIYKFNSDPDYNWHLTMGHALIHGKIPYRDLFDHKGPLVYFLYGFCCLFPTPHLTMLLIEILCMSLFFFFAYRIAKKFLNNFNSLLTLLILAFIVFAACNRITNASCIEEFCLPMLTYSLYCWIEFILEKKQWTWTRSLIIGICVGIVFWSKFTILCFIIPIIVIWFIKSLKEHQYKCILKNIILLLTGVIIISSPIIFYYGLHNALIDLFNIYFYINISIYTKGTSSFIENLKLFTTYNFFIILLTTYGLSRFIILYCKNNRVPITISFVFTLFFSILINKFLYGYNIILPYTIFGIIAIIDIFESKLSMVKKQLLLYITYIFFIILICLPISILPLELHRTENDYTPLEIAKIIKENTLNTKTTILCYKILDLGIYNALEIIPNNYYFAQNSFSKDQYPKMYKSYENYITSQTSDFIITNLGTWLNEEEFLSKYYLPIMNYNNRSVAFSYKKLHYNYYIQYDLVILKKINHDKR